MRKIIRMTAVLGLVTAGAISTMAAPAAHADSTGSNGLDCIPNFIVGGGSDTTSIVMQQLGDSYSNLTGGDLIKGPNWQVTTAPCVQPAVPTNSAPAGSPIVNTPGNNYGNFDKDSVGQATAFGSGAGIAAACSSAAGAPFANYGANPAMPIDFARSSKDLVAAELANCAAWGFARDAVVFTTYGRVATGLTQAQITSIYNGTVTDWSQVNAAYAPGTIQVWGMNSGSGTFAVGSAYVGLSSVNRASNTPAAGTAQGRNLIGTGTCAAPNGVFPFENDHRNIVLDPCFDAANAIWFGSNGEYLTFPAKRGTATVQATRVNTPAIPQVLSGAYQPQRFLNHVTNKTDATCASASGTACDAFPLPTAATGDLPVTGASAGKGGAVREFTRALCRQPVASPGTNPYDSQTNSGLAQTQEFTNIISANNLVGVGAAANAGSRCRIVIA